MSDNVVIKDFTKKRKVIQFDLDGHRYVCYPALAIPSLQEISTLAADFTPATAVEQLTKFFEVILPDEDAMRLSAKLTDKNNPLELDQAADIMHWVVEAYGLRPTTSSSASSNGSPTDGDGTRSAVGA